jgi:hypothetical protein
MCIALHSDFLNYLVDISHIELEFSSYLIQSPEGKNRQLDDRLQMIATSFFYDWIRKVEYIGCV